MRKCKHCGKRNTAKDTLFVNMKAFCNWHCVSEYGKTDKAKATYDKVMRQEHRRKKDSLKSINDRLAEAQAVFNAYIRIRDKHKPCVSCGKPAPANLKGNQRDSSHYLARGAAYGSIRRFDPLNVWASCKTCNNYKSGNLIPYRVELINRIGEKRVLEIESENRIKKWNHEDLKRLKTLFTRKKKLYEKLFRK